MAPVEEQPEEGGTPLPLLERAIGVDVSHWQGKMDWQQTKSAGASFAIIKATEGTTFVDSRFFENAAGAREAGLLTGAYHFYKNKSDPESQAAHFAQIIAQTPLDLPPIVDIEERVGTVSPNAIHAFVKAVEKEVGRRPIIYTSTGFWAGLGSTPWAASYDLWLAQYHNQEEPTLPTSWSTWVFWQYTSQEDGRSWGASSNFIDLNRFRGTIGELRQQYGHGPSIAENVLRNPSFEDGTYKWQKVDDVNCPNEYDFWYADATTPNPHNPYPKAQFRRPKVLVLQFEDLPRSEKEVVDGPGRRTFSSGDHILKLQGRGSMWVELSQSNILEAGRWRLTLKQFANLVDEYDAGDNKVWAHDPFGRDGLLSVYANGNALIEHKSLEPGKWTTVEVDFEANGETEIMVNYMCPFALVNNDIFGDAWSLVKIDGPAPPMQYAVVINLLPLDATLAEKLAVLEAVHRNRETISQMAEDVARLAVSRTASSKVKVWEADRWDYDIVAWLKDRGVELVEVLAFPD